ncbi:MAG: EAL domain-containing protein [Gammaproteobacteria bacterium]|nr:EAL domain-containing protein [Gammaproteobacteria bacterium]
MSDVNKLNLRILVIDDNPEIHKDFIKILSTTSNQDNNELNSLEDKLLGNKKTTDFILPRFLIDVASQGQEGVALIKKAIDEGNPYALAFVDIRMPPGWDGIETIEHIWELDPDMQIVICTAYSDYSWEETVQRLGQRENLLILKKPFDNVAVRQLACALTRKWQLIQESRIYTISLEDRVKERTLQLEQSLSVARGTLESSADGILVINESNKIIDYNNILIDMWKISKSMLDLKDGAALLEYIASQMENSEQFLKLLQELSLQPDVVKLDKLKTVDNRYFEHYSQPYKQNGKLAGRIWSFRDITKRALLEDKLHYYATHDELTGLPNRAMLADAIVSAISKAKRDNTLVGIIFFDLDRFKLVNDSLSHSIGDELLKQVGIRLSPCVRAMDTLARLGGDEFVLVVPAIADKRDMARIAIKILAKFAEPFLLLKHKVNVTPSIGISIYPIEGKDPEELLRHADIAMYRAKTLKGNQFQFYTKEIGKQSMERLEKESDLRQAIANNEFFLLYQPEYDLQSKQLISVEALIRWQHPTKGLILPLDFIPLAEDTGMIVEIGTWVLYEACRQNKRWQEAGLPRIRVAVNVASQQLSNPDLFSIIQAALKETELEPCYLELELTENVIISNAESLKTIEELSKLGLHITLDDFGTGYSCLNYLRTMPVNTIKIDKSFVNSISKEKGDEFIIQAIISMADSLNLNILAEGIETKKQLEFLKSKQCGSGQGFYFSEPIAVEGIEDILRSKNLN